MLVKPFVKPIIVLVAGAVVGTGSVILFNHLKGRKASKEEKEEVDEFIDEIDEEVDEFVDELDHAAEVLNTGIAKIDQMIKDNEEFMADVEKEFNKIIELHKGQLSEEELQKELDQITDNLIDAAGNLKYNKEVLDKLDNIDLPETESEVDDLPEEVKAESEVDDLPEEVKVEEAKKETESEVDDLPEEVKVEEADIPKPQKASGKKKRK